MVQKSVAKSEPPRVSGRSTATPGTLAVKKVPGWPQANRVDTGRGGEIKESTTHVEAFVELFRDAGSIPAASTFFRNEPFGENVEGLSYCGAKSCVVERAVR